MIKKFLICLKAIFDGLFTVFKHALKRRVTLEYPEKKSVLSNNFRGKIEWCGEKCFACKACERVCPANAISINKEDNKIKMNLDLSKCIFCGNCHYYCNSGALVLTDNYELATDNKSELNIHKVFDKNINGEINE
jgi:formate hydrogenlyase subunit 6/NADH:ubiquinone oxidoreductase subunit I